MQKKGNFPKVIRYCYKPKARNRFTKEEDERLLSLICHYASNDMIIWSDVAAKMENRSSRQCRERYYNYLIEETKKGDWSKEEDNLIFFLFDKFGPNWVKMSNYFYKRSNIDIKNRHASLLRKQNIIHQQNYNKKTNDSSPIIDSKQKNEINYANVNQMTTFFNNNNIHGRLYDIRFNVIQIPTYQILYPYIAS